MKIDPVKSIDNKKEFHINALLALVFLLTGLITACVPRILKPISVFGTDVPFQTDSENPDVLIYQHPSLRASSYSKFLIDPVKIISNESPGHGLAPQEEKRLAESFREELIKALDNRYEITNEPAAGVLRIKTAILDIQPAHLELDEEEFIVLRLDTLLARVSMELECVDAATGERVAALIHRLQGDRFMTKEKKTRLLNIREAFHDWTRSLRQRLDEAKARPRKEFDGPDREENKRLKLEQGE
jgi:hypothetical protein